MRLLDPVHELELQVDCRADPALRLFETTDDDVLGDLRRAFLVEAPRRLGAAGLDHHDGNVTVGKNAAGDDDLKGRLVAFLVGRVRDPLTVMMRESHRADRAVERNAGDHESRRRAVDRGDVVRVLEVGTQDRGDHLHLVAETLGERGSQRPVGEPAGQDGLLAGPALTAEERAGNLPGRVHPFLHVDGEGKEVDALAGLARDDGRQQRRVADLHHNRAVRERREPAGLERHDLAGRVDRAGDTNGACAIGLFHLGTRSLLSARATRRFPVVRVRSGGPGRWRLTTVDAPAQCAGVRLSA